MVIYQPELIIKSVKNLGNIQGFFLNQDQDSNKKLYLIYNIINGILLSWEFRVNFRAQKMIPFSWVFWNHFVFAILGFLQIQQMVYLNTIIMYIYQINKKIQLYISTYDKYVVIEKQNFEEFKKIKKLYIRFGNSIDIISPKL